MAKKKQTLLTEINHDYTLIMIKSVLEDFRLAYFINNTFNVILKKEKFSLNFHNKKGEFTVFGFEDFNTNAYWSLIANKQIIEIEEEQDNYNLFAAISNTYILIQEEKTVDYFLKIENNHLPITTIIQKLNSIHKVITSYEVNPVELKSKDYLIF